MVRRLDIGAAVEELVNEAESAFLRRPVESGLATLHRGSRAMAGGAKVGTRGPHVAGGRGESCVDMRRWDRSAGPDIVGEGRPQGTGE
jgi:hypothetical protein